MNGLRNHGNTATEIKYPPNCTTRVGGGDGPTTAVSAAPLAGGVAAVPDGMTAHDLNLLDKLYEPKANKKLFRVVTVIAYCFCVSLIAILLSLYYLFLWDPYIKNNPKLQLQTTLPTRPPSTLSPEAAWATKGPRVLGMTSPVLEKARKSQLVEEKKSTSWVVKPSKAMKSSRLLEAPKVLGLTRKDSAGNEVDRHRMEDPFTLYAKGN